MGLSVETGIPVITVFIPVSYTHLDVYKRQTLRSSISANDNKWAAMLYDEGNYYFSKNYLMHIVDRVGGGDSFGAGLIYSCCLLYTSRRV